MSVALLMFQRSVDDWPFSMVDGSAVKLAITGLDPDVGGPSPVCVTGSGVLAFTGFLQPEVNTTSAIDSSAALNFVAFDLVIFRTLL
jgi:hypothetical protein